MTLPWREKSTSKRARLSEERAAKLSGGQRVPMSGAGRQKGDMRTPMFLTEDKETAAASYRVELSTLDKITHEAVSTGRLPQLRLTIGGRSWRMIRESDYLELEERWNQHRQTS